MYEGQYERWADDTQEARYFEAPFDPEGDDGPPIRTAKYVDDYVHSVQGYEERSRDAR